MKELRKRLVGELKILDRHNVKRVIREKHPQPWTWAQKHEERVRKHWQWKLLDAMWDNMKAQSLRCVPLSHYGWKAFGFDKRFKPTWTIQHYTEV